MSYVKKEGLYLKAEGFLRIWEQETGKVLLNHHNAIHQENLSVAFSSALASLSNPEEYQKECLEWIAFGNGGARATSSNKYIYSTPQTLGRSSLLYHETYRKNIGTEHNANNNIKVTHVSGNLYTDITVNCVLGMNEPSDQDLTNIQSGNGDITSKYTFSEIGLMTKGSGTGDDSHLLTHICCYPIEKAQNISIAIQYLLRVQMV